MGKRLYVGNLPFSATEAELTEMFSQCGQVESARLITDRQSGRSKGFAFVEMATDEEAETCITALHGKQLEGRQLTVSEARPLERRPTGGFGGGFGAERSGGRSERGSFGGHRRSRY